MPTAGSSDLDRKDALGVSHADKQDRPPWRAPTLTRVPINQTLLGGTVGNEGNGVFAFRASPP